MLKINYSFLIVLIFLLVGCSKNEVVVKSTDTYISRYQIKTDREEDTINDGLQEKDEFYTIFKNKKNEITAVIHFCKSDSSNKLYLKIDDISCDDNSINLNAKIQKLQPREESCSGFEKDNYKLIFFKNAVFKIDLISGKLIATGLVNGEENIFFRYGYQVTPCSLLEKGMKEAKEKGFKSIVERREFAQRKLKESQQDNNWYAIPSDFQFANKCDPFDLKGYVKNLMELNWNHSIDEFEKDDGLPVAVKISLREQGERQGDIYAYKGIVRCTSKLNQLKDDLAQSSNTKKREIDNKLNRY